MSNNIKKTLVAIITIGIIPLELFLFKVAEKLIDANDIVNLALSNIAISYIGFIIILLLNIGLLKTDIGKFKEKLGRNILISILLVLIMHGALYLVRIPLNNLSMDNGNNLQSAPLYLSILLMLVPLTSAIIEEIVFRYHLFNKFENKIFKFIMFFVSAALFGLIHYNNFQGDLIQLIPYAVMGMIFNLIYLFSKNIWNSITVHLIFNGVNVFMGIFGLVIMQFVG